MTYFSRSRQKKPLQEQPRDARNDAPVPDTGTLAYAVDRARREVADAGVPDVQVDEEVVREP